MLKLVLTYYALLRSCWDEEKLRPKVLEANLKSCLLVQRIVRIHDALDADGGALRPIEWSSEISDIGENETDHAKSASDQCNVQGDTSAAVEETDDVDESDDSDHDSYSPDRVAAMCCTFTETGRQFVEQHWYYCYTCGMTWGEGICRVCALVCHKVSWWDSRSRQNQSLNHLANLFVRTHCRITRSHTLANLGFSATAALELARRQTTMRFAKAQMGQ